MSENEVKESKEPVKHDNSPIVETSMNLSKDKKYFIHKTIITDIKPVTYIEKVMGI